MAKRLAAGGWLRATGRPSRLLKVAQLADGASDLALCV
jgi:hypothetical protein